MKNAGLEPKPCVQCGQAFSPPSYAIGTKKWKERKYCCHACAYESLIGRPRSAEHCRNISLAKKGVPNPKQAAALRGRKLPEERKRRISETLKGRTREKNHAWKGRDVGYAARHYRNQKSFVPPDDGLCEHCRAPVPKGTRSKRHQWAFLHHPQPHTETQEDYLYLCASCHHRMDAAARKRDSLR